MPLSGFKKFFILSVQPDPRALTSIRSMICSLLLGFGVCLPDQAYSQTPFPTSAGDPSHSLETLELTELSGLTMEEVKGRFGTADKETDDGGIIRWDYGKSFVVFTNGKVTAWNSAGDLWEREFNARPPDKSSDYGEEGALAPKGWRNEWTHEDPPPKTEVIDELLDK